MADKTFNTRIALKIDTLENWSKSTIGLKKGELALATVASSAGTGLKEPVIMIKVGEDGVKTFKDLEWNVYAKAADVLAACKTEDGLTAFINNVINNAGLSSNEAFSALEDRVEAVESKFGYDTVAEEISAALANYSTTTQMNAAIATAKGEAVSHADGLNTAMNTRVAALEAIDHTHSFVESELNLIKAGDVAKWNAAEQNAKGYADNLNTAMDSRVDALEAKFTGDNSVDAKITAAVAAEAKLRGDADTGLGNRITTIENDYLKEADKTALQGQITELDGLVGDKKVSEQITDVTNPLAARVKAVEDDYLKAADKKALQDQIDANESAIELLTNGVSSTEVDGVNDLIQYVKDHGTEVTGIKADINANADAIDAIKDGTTIDSFADVETALAGKQAAGNYSVVGHKHEIADVNGLSNAIADAKKAGTDAAAAAGQALTDAKKYTDDELADFYSEKLGGKTVSETVSAAITALAIGDYAKAADLNAAVGRISTAEGKITALEGKAHEHTNKAVLDGITSEKVAAWDKVSEKANTADLHAIATSGNVMDLVQTTGDILIFDCGTSV